MAAKQVGFTLDLKQVRLSAERPEMGKVFRMAGAAYENFLEPIVVDDAWVSK